MHKKKSIACFGGAGMVKWNDRKHSGKEASIFWANNWNFLLDAACDKALTQIEDQQYAAVLEEDGMKTIIKYGIACYKKECKVKLG